MAMAGEAHGTDDGGVQSATWCAEVIQGAIFRALRDKERAFGEWDGYLVGGGPSQAFAPNNVRELWGDTFHLGFPYCGYRRDEDLRIEAQR